MTGIDKSRTTKSGRSSFAFSTPSRPSTASPHTVQPSLNSRILRSAPRIAGLSSTTNIRLGTPRYYGPGFARFAIGSKPDGVTAYSENLPSGDGTTIVSDSRIANIERVGRVVLKCGLPIFWEFFAGDTKATQTQPTTQR